MTIMTSIIVRLTTKSVILTSSSYFKNILSTKQRQPSRLFQHLRNSSSEFSYSTIIGSHRSVSTGLTKTNKRITNKQNESFDGSLSVIAYNLSDELAIENAQKLLENFKEYQFTRLPNDLQNEAVMLSLKSTTSSDDEKLVTQSANPEVLESISHKVFLFREGSIVFWGVPHDQQKRVLYGLSSLKIEPHSNELIQEEREYMSYCLAPTQEKSRLNRDVIQLATKQDKSQLHLDQFAISHAVALSVKLGIWESILDQYIESIGWVTNNMKQGKDMHLTRKQVFGKIGELYELKHCINLRSDLLDLPDVYWDRHDQEILFLSVTSFLNLKKRTAVINEKLNNCCELMNLIASHINDRHHIRLEWMIIILITFEVLFEIVRFFY